MPRKRKAQKKKSTTRRAPPRPSARRAQPPPLPREIPLEQGLRELAHEGASSLLSAVVAFAVIAAIAGLLFGAWSLRPMPEFTSDAIEAGSPFDVAFQVRNTSAWVALLHPAIACVLTPAGQPEGQPVAAVGIATARLGPGESARFTCPFRTHDLDTALHAELAFRTSYDLPFGLSWRFTERSPAFVVDTRHLPPRWTAR